MRNDALYNRFGDDPFAPQERRFSVERIRLVAKGDYAKVNWAIATIQEYNDQRRNDEFAPGRYPTEPRAADSALTASRSRGGRGGGPQGNRRGKKNRGSIL